MGAKRAGSTEKATSGSSRPQRFMLQSDFFSWGAALRWQAGPSGSGSFWPWPCSPRLHISGQVQPRPCIGHILTGSSVMAVRPGANGLSSSSAARTPANGARSHAEEKSTNGIIPLCWLVVTKVVTDIPTSTTLPHPGAVEHHPLYAAHGRDRLQWVLLQQDQVGKLTRLHRPQPLLYAEKPRRQPGGPAATMREPRTITTESGTCGFPRRSINVAPTIAVTASAGASAGGLTSRSPDHFSGGSAADGTARIKSRKKQVSRASIPASIVAAAYFFANREQALAAPMTSTAEAPSSMS